MAKAPGRSNRTGITLAQLLKRFPDDEAAEKWLIEQRWPSGVCCLDCGSTNVQHRSAHPTMKFRCRETECPTQFFSTKTGTVMEGSKIGYQNWLIATFLMMTSLKGISSMKLHRDLGMTQRTAWFMAQRLRAAMTADGGLFSGPVEVDETYMGGKRKSMPESKRKGLTGRGVKGKIAVVGARDRATKKVAAKVVSSPNRPNLHGFVKERVAPTAKVYTDEARVYLALPFDHEVVKHKLKEYVRGDVHTNGIESLWSMLKRAHKGTFHKLSPKHLDRYVQEFAGRHNARDLDTIDQMAEVASGMQGKRLKYSALVADNGLPSGARS